MKLYWKFYFQIYMNCEKDELSLLEQKKKNRAKVELTNEM